EDKVVLDLMYEARDIDQHLGSQEKIDAWFDAKTKGLNDWQRADLREKWGTMQSVLSSKSRMDRVVSDIVFDFSVKPRLSDERAKKLFKTEPANMKLLIVVDKLLTGFDAPPCTISISTKVCRITVFFRPFAAPTGSTAKTNSSATSWITKISLRRSRMP